MSNLSDLLPAGAGAKSATFTASGTLSSGQAVALQSDGTVSAITGTSQSIGSEVVFETTQTGETKCIFDSNSNKIVIAYRDEGNSNYGTAVVGTVSGTSISFGTPVVFESAYITNLGAAFDSNSNKTVFAYRDNGNSNYGTAIVGTVSGTSISFGSAVVYNTANTLNNPVVFDSNSNKIVISYRDVGNSSYGTSIVGTVSGTSISFGTSTVFESATTLWLSATFDSNSNKVVVAYQDNTNSSNGTAVVGTVSGTSISFGTPVVFNANTTTQTTIAFDSTANKVVTGYSDNGSPDTLKAIVGDVSGTSITFGTAVALGIDNPNTPSVVFDSNANKVVISTRDGGNSNYGTLVPGTVSGTSISFESSVVFNAGTTSFVSSVYDSNAAKVVTAYQDSNFISGTAIVFQNASTNSADFIGITDQAIANTATGSVVVEGGVTEKLSGLTTGSTYYVQDDGSLSTTSSSVTAGKALSATKLLLKG